MDIILPAPEITLEAKVAFLRQPTSFPEATYRVEAIETHMSWVFLTDQHAYKLKKPVHYDFLDFSTIEARRHYCAEEVRLNQRLAATVYLGIVPLLCSAAKHLHLHEIDEASGSAANVVDWLVKMQRLPMQHMLDYAIQHETASAADIKRIAARLVDFYQTCTPIAIHPAEYRDKFLTRIDGYLQELSQAETRISIQQIQAIFSAQRTVVRNMAELFNERVRAGKIVEGHGDLRPEHICLDPPPVIIDCLEFSRDLRLIDCADEIAFLALECERLGASGWANLLLHTYGAISHDHPPAALIHFYQSYRAGLRATIAIRHLKEEKFRYSPIWPQRAMEYLQLAKQHAASALSH